MFGKAKRVMCSIYSRSAKIRKHEHSDIKRSREDIRISDLQIEEIKRRAGKCINLQIIFLIHKF